MSRVLLLLPVSSYRAGDFMVAADRLGLDILVGSDDEPPFDLGDRFVRIDCDDVERSVADIVGLADRVRIDAIVPVDDAGVVIAARAAERLGLPGNPRAAAEATRDKVAMRRLMQAREVPQPRFEVIDEAEVSRLRFPLVLKPRTGSASLGVVRVDTVDELKAAFDQVRAIASGHGEAGPLLAEEYVEGAEMAVEGQVIAGRLVVLAHFDKPHTPTGPTFPETILVTPTRADVETVNEIDRVVERGVAALGLTDGPVHAEVKVDGEGRIHLLEVAARSIGGLCSRSLLFGLGGARLEELILAAAVGEPVDEKLQPRPSGVMMIPVPSSGRLGKVSGVESALSVDGVTSVDLTAVPGSRVGTLPEEARYLGFIFAQASTPESVVASLEEAATRLRFEIRPD